MARTSSITVLSASHQLQEFCFHYVIPTYIQEQAVSVTQQIGVYKVPLLGSCHI